MQTRNGAGGPDALRLEGVTKAFGRVPAVDDLDLAVPRGTIYGLLGPNGSGKTTTIRMIMGILGPDRGRVRLLGEAPTGARSRVGYLPEERGLYRKMKALDHLVFLARIRGVPRDAARERAAAWLERFELADRGGDPVEELSKGMQQKLQFIGTVLHEPELLVLDEPYSGLDPLNQDVLEGIIREFQQKGVTILLSTHLMDLAERLCEHVCLISRARKVLDGRLEALRDAEGRDVMAVEFQGPDDWLPESRRVTGGGEAPRDGEGPRGVRIRLAQDGDPDELLRRALAAGARITRFELQRPRLHEIFVRHAGGGSEAKPAARPAGSPAARPAGRPGTGPAAGPGTGPRAGQGGRP